MRVAGIATSTLMFAALTGAIVTAPTAMAECSTASGQMICSDASPDGTSTGPGVPSSCDIDWLCDEEDLGVLFDPDHSGADNPPNPPRPDRPDFGRPGRPGNRP